MNLDPWQILTELADHYREGEASGPGLLAQLDNALGESKYNSDQNSGVSSGKPCSRPPGWREDASELIFAIRWGVDDHWTRAGFTPPPDVFQGLRLLLDVTTRPQQAEDDITEWRRLARLTLGYQVPSASLPDVSCGQYRYNPTRGGRYQVGCGETTLRIAEDMASDVWCANPACHDPELGYDCEPITEDELIVGWTCRRTPRDLRHAIRWTREQIARMADNEAA
jgi:hypothetical protein